MFALRRIPLFPILFQQPVRYFHIRETKKPLNKEERLQLMEQTRKKAIFDALTSALNGKQYLSVDEWKVFRENAHRERVATPDAGIFYAIKALDSSKNTFRTLKNFLAAFNIQENSLVKSTFVDLFASKAARHKLTNSEETELIQLCNELIENDMCLLELMNKTVANGLCATKEWKRVLDLPKINEMPGSLNIVIRKAIREVESSDFVWSLIDKLTNRFPNELSNKTLTSYWIYCTKNKNEFAHNVEKMLQLLERTERILDEQAAMGLLGVLRNAKCPSERIKMDFSGHCPNCKKSLDVVTLTNDEFRSVQRYFLEKVVHGKNIYYKTTPEEWSSFVNLIDKNGPFDVVMDGLNIAFESEFAAGKNEGKKARPNMKTLIAAVEQFVRARKRVLVIGRRHMERWPQIDRLMSLATTYLVDNISKDDIFLLYGAMASGPSTYILSNDYMRNHKFAMGRKMDELFKKWQQQNSRGFRFDLNRLQPIKPMKFKMHCHQNDGQWHIPFISDAERAKFNWYALPENWICLRC